MVDGALSTESSLIKGVSQIETGLREKTVTVTTVHQLHLDQEVRTCRMAREVVKGTGGLVMLVETSGTGLRPVLGRETGNGR